MTWLKLQKAGDSATIIVRQLGVVEGRLGEQLRFQSTKGQDVYVPLEVGYALLERCGFGDRDAVQFDQVRGALLKFARIAAPDLTARPHWSITRVDAAGSREHQSSATESSPMLNDHLPPASAGPSVEVIALADRRAQIVDAFRWATQTSSDVQHAVAKKKGHPKPTADSIQAGATTLMLRAERMGAI